MAEEFDAAAVVAAAEAYRTLKQEFDDGKHTVEGAATPVVDLHQYTVVRHPPCDAPAPCCSSAEAFVTGHSSYTPQQLNASAQNARRTKAAKHARDNTTQVYCAPAATRTGAPTSAADALGIAAAAAAALEGLTLQQCNTRRQNARRAELKRAAKAAVLAPPLPWVPPAAPPKRLLGAVAELWERKKARHADPPA